MSDYNSSMPVRTENAGDVIVKVGDGTTPSQQLAIDSSGRPTVKLDDGAGNSITSQTNGSQQALDVGIDVGGVQIDPRSIRALTSSDVVTANQGSANTSANGWPVKVTDGTNVAAVKAASTAASATDPSVVVALSPNSPIPTGTNTIGTVNSKTEDGSGTGITSTSVNSKQRLDVDLAAEGVTGSAAPFDSVQVGGSDGTNLRTIKTDTSGRVNVDLFDNTGTPYSVSNPLFVQQVSGLGGTEVNDYNTSSAVAAGGTSNHDYTITSSKTFKGKMIWASASGKMKIEVQVSPDGTTFTSKWVAFTSTANPNVYLNLDMLTFSDSGTGAKIRIIRTNADKAAMDVYSTISGNEY